MTQPWRYRFWNCLSETLCVLRWTCDDLADWFDRQSARAGIRALRYERPRPNRRKE